MPISLTRRSGAGGKDKKINSNGENNDSSVISVESVDAKCTDSSQNVSKNGAAESASNSIDMKAIMGRGTKVKQLDPDSSSLGSVETGKEAKEKDKRSWMKTIGIRTLRKKKNQDFNKCKDDDSINSSDLPQNTSFSIPSSASTSVIHESVAVSVEDQPVVAEKSSGKISFKIKKSSSAQASGTNSSGANGTHAGANGETGGIKPKSGSTHSKNGGKHTAKSSNDNEESGDKQDPARFAGDGMTFKGKLIGVLEVSGPRGDRICQEALSELKMAVKAAGEHKQKITIHIALDGLRIRDEKTGDCLYHHQVHKISFIAQDLTDARAFGYIFGSPDMGHRFFGIKTEKSASQVVISMRDLFQVVFDLKKKEIERAKQQLEMQQKFLATRAAETAPKVEPKSSIAETYIEGACALGASGGSATQEVDLLNLEVELNSLQEGLDNIHTNLAETMPFRGSTASISSDPMNQKMSVSSLGGGNTNSNFITSTGDPFGDSFDPFDASVSFASASSGGQKHGVGSMMTSPSPVVFGATDPFAQIDPFPTPKFTNLESSDSFFSSDPFDSPVGNASFNFGSDRPETHHSGGNHGRNINGFDSDGHRKDGSHDRSSENGKAAFAANWQASFDDVRDHDDDDNNFVGESALSEQSKGTGLDIFTDLDPLGTGRVKPFVDRKDFFQDLKNPPRKILKDLHANDSSEQPPTAEERFSDSFGMNASFSPSQLTSNTSSSSIGVTGLTGGGQGMGTSLISGAPSGLSTTLNQVQLQMDTVHSIPNSFSTNFNPSSGAGTSTTNNSNTTLAPITGFDSAFKSPAHASVMSITAKTSQGITRNSREYGSGRSKLTRSDSPPRYSPPPIPESERSQSIISNSTRNRYTSLNAFSNNEYFATPLKSTQPPPPLLPPPSSNITSSPTLGRANKKSPQLLKQMTIASAGLSAPGSSSPKTLPRSVRLGKQLTVDACSSEENSPIPNLTPPPRPPHGGTLGKNKTLSTAVPRPYSALTGLGAGSEQRTNRYDFGPNFTFNRDSSTPSVAPEPPPRPLQTTMITTINGSASLNQQSLPLVSPPPPLPPKKSAVGPTLSNPLVFPSKNNVLSDNTTKRESKQPNVNNDLPLPLPSRKTQQYTSWNGGINNPLSFTQSDRYCVPQSLDTGSSVNQPKLQPSQLSKLSMEQALQQVASMSLGQLAAKLECPVESLSSFTIQQLAEKLTLMEISRGSSPANFPDNRNKPASTHGGSITNISHGSSGFKSDLTFEDDFSTMSAPVGGVHHQKTRSGGNSGTNYDRYAVFRELTVEDASGFTVGGDVFATDNMDNDDDDDISHSRTFDLDKTLTGRDSSSERTFQVEGHGLPVPCTNASTMDDVTDANLSDEHDKFPMDDEECSISSNRGMDSEWATFEANFEDSFNPICPPAPAPSEPALPPPSKKPELFTLSSKKKSESPWDSDESVEEKVTPNAEVPSATKYRYDIGGDDKFLDIILPPDPEEFNFQPFEKPAPIVAVGASGISGNSTSRESSAGKRSGRNQDNNFDPLEIESRTSQFVRQSSGSSKHSIGKNSDYSDSGRRHSSRKNSRDYEHWDRSDSLRRERTRDGDYYHHRSDSRNSYSSTTRNPGERKLSYRDSEEEFEVVPFKYPGSMSRESGSRHRGGSRSRPTSGRNPDVDDEDGVDDEDDRSYASYHSNHSSSKKSSRSRRYVQNHVPHQSLHPVPGPPRKHVRRRGEELEVSPERFSNNDSDYEGDSYEDDKRRDHHPRDYHDRGHGYSSGTGRRSRDRPPSSSGGSLTSKRYSDRDRYDRERDYGSRHTIHRYPPSSSDRRRGPRSEREYRHRDRNHSPSEKEEGRDYSDYSGDDYEGSSSMRRRRREHGRGRSGGYYRDRDGRRDRDPRDGKPYQPHSASFDSESQSPDRDGGESQSGGDRRKIRFNPRRDKDDQVPDRPNQSRDNSNSPSPRSSAAGQRRGGEKVRSKSGSKPSYHFDDHFSVRSEERFEAAFEENMMKSHKAPPPQSPFEDNFVVKAVEDPNLIGSPTDDQPASIEFKRGTEEDNFGIPGVSGDVFFPTKFDVDLEIEMESKLFNEAVAASLASDDSSSVAQTPVSTDSVRVSPARLHGSAISFGVLSHSLSGSNNKRLESIRSEEERLESSEDGGGEEEEREAEAEEVKEEEETRGLAETAGDGLADIMETEGLSPIKPVSEDGGNIENLVEVESNEVTLSPADQVPCESSMKKSESFNIFDQAKDPFADDDFFS